MKSQLCKFNYLDLDFNFQCPQSVFRKQCLVHLLHKYDLNSAQTGLVFLNIASTYTLFSPLVGKMFDKGMGGLVLITMGLLVLGFLVMGPLSRLELLSSLWVTVASMGVQVVGVSLVYIGSLLTMRGALAQLV